MVVVSTRSETARARSPLDVTKMSACSCVQGYESGVVGRLPPQLVRDPPRRPLQHLVTEEAHLQGVDARDPLDSLGGGDLTPPGCLIQRRQRLRADERRRDELVRRCDLDLASDDPEQRVTVDDEPRHTATLHAGAWRCSFSAVLACTGQRRCGVGSYA